MIFHYPWELIDAFFIGYTDEHTGGFQRGNEVGQ
jgi:hypothetical protein